MNKKKIIVSTLVGTIALAALSISLTLAWYGANDRLSVENLEVGVYGKGDLRISTSPEIDTFVENLVDTEQIGFQPVSSMFKSTWMNEKDETPRFYESAYKHILSNGEPYKEEAEYGFYRKEIYLLTNIRNQFAALDFDSEDVSKEERQGSLLEREDLIDDAKNQARAEKLHQENPDWNLSVSEIKEKLDNIANCLRISILVNYGNSYRYYIIDPTRGENEVTYLGGLLDNDKNGYYDTYKDINSVSREVVYGEVNDRNLIAYNDPKSDTLPVTHPETKDPYFGNSFIAEHKPTAYEYNKDLSEANGFEIAKEESLSLQQLKNDDTSVLIPLTSGVPSKIVLSIYLEGWDLDCINATMGASFMTKIGFKLKGGNI